MNLLLAVAIILPVLGSQPATPTKSFTSFPSLPVNVAAIPLPPGYERISASINSFTAWLRNIPLKKSRVVYLYNGMAKRNQDAQFVVLDVSVTPGSKPDGSNSQDLQQCADAVMRLRAEFLFEKQR